MRAITISALVTIALSPSGLAAQVSRPEPVPPPSEDVLALPSDVPDRFVPNHDGDPVPYGDRVCAIEYQDPRDGTALKLIRSVSAKITTLEGEYRITRETSYGDYLVEVPNRYGVEGGRALRIDCVSSKSIGIVERFPDGTR